MSMTRKCPNCGYETTEDFCPNCDVFGRDLPTIKKEETKEKHKEKDLTLREKKMNPAEETVLKPKMQAAIEKNKIEKFQSPKSIKEKVVKEEKLKDMPSSKSKREKGIPTQGETVKSKKEKGIPTQGETAPTSAIDSSKEKDVKKRSKNKKTNKWIAILVVFFVLIGGGAYLYNHQQKEKEEERVAQIEREKQIIKTDLLSMYYDEEKIFLHEQFEEKDLLTSMKKIEKLEDVSAKKELQKLAKDLSSRYAKQKTVNDLFEKNIIIGNHLGEAILKSDVVLVPGKYENTSDEFTALLNKGLEEARIQNEAVSNAKVAVATVFEKDVKPEATRPLYDDAKVQVEKVKNPTIRQDFMDKLNKVDEHLKQKEKEEQEAKEAKERETRIKKEQESQNQSVTSNQRVNGEDPWAWEPGIQEKVIGECMRRGYIVEGGYYLEKKEVRNGEGYYDLYASNTQSSLLKDRKPEETPIYLVTINCKTGWFKGNGPN